MTDVLVRVLVPYSRFLDVRARRLRIAAELAQAAPGRPIDVAVASAPLSNDEGACAAVILPTSPAPGVQPR
jgi:hypothetical protein